MLVRITKENRTNFKGIVPGSILELFFNDENTFGIGIAPDKDSFPVAALVFGIDIETDDDGGEHVVSELKWIYVDEEARENGAATFLFAEYLNLLDDSGVEAVKTYIPLDTGYNLLCNVLEDFGFVFDMTESFEISETLDTIIDIKGISRKNFDKNVRALSEVDPRFFSNGLIAIADEGEMDDYRLSLNPENYDPDVSMIYAREKVPVGYLLVRHPEEKLLDVVFLRTLSDEPLLTLYKMLSKAREAAYEKYDSDTVVHAKIRSNREGAIVSQLLPEAASHVLRRGYFVL